MSKAADPDQQHPVGQPTIAEVVPSTTAGVAAEFDKAIVAIGVTKATRRVSIAIIVIYIIALVAFDFYFLTQIVVTLLALIMAGVVLCNRAFSKCVLSGAAILYSVGFAGDVWRSIEWFLFLDYVNDSTDDGVDEVGLGWAFLFALPNILGALLVLAGAMFARKTTRKWQQSGAPPV
eukprot:g9114.t1